MNIRKLQVSRFRSFRDLEIEGFGQVNLITGKNNAGKSTLLEAIRILATQGSHATLQAILSYREESGQPSEDSGLQATPEDFGAFCSLFTDFPTIADCVEPLEIAAETDKERETRVSIKVGWYTEQLDPEAGRRYIPVGGDLFGETGGFPALEVRSGGRTRTIRFDRMRQPFLRSALGTSEGELGPCVYLDPFSSRSTTQLGGMWDAIALTEAEKAVVGALRIISPEIEAVSMIGSNSGSRSRTAIARCAGHAHPVPIRSFGDGVNRLFGIVLSLTAARGGILLVDEIENGLHHSILARVWQTIFDMARDLGLQVFATTHSWDCIEAFQEAARLAPEAGVLVRLTATETGVIPTIFREQDLEIASREKIELR